jgi:DNA-binding MarR family transcriptional regulator
MFKKMKNLKKLSNVEKVLYILIYYSQEEKRTIKDLFKITGYFKSNIYTSIMSLEKKGYLITYKKNNIIYIVK